MADRACPYYVRRWWDLLVSSDIRFSNECCELQDTFDGYNGGWIDGICNSDDFKTCSFYLSNKENREIPQE